MKLTKIVPQLDRIPEEFHPLLLTQQVYDSSCSPNAQVLFIDQDEGYFLKRAPKDTLHQESVMTRYFYGKHLAAEVLSYVSNDQDWMLTKRLPGEACLAHKYLDNPSLLCDTLAQLLRQLHDESIHGCPAADLTVQRLGLAEKNYRTGQYDKSMFPDNWGFSTPEEAWNTVLQNGKYLKTDTLVHGDYCLPNVLLDNWKFSGFIDLGGAGVSDRHFDLFWGIWSLSFNLKTNDYCDRFLDAYGRNCIETEALHTIAAIEVFG